MTWRTVVVNVQNGSPFFGFFGPPSFGKLCRPGNCSTSISQPDMSTFSTISSCVKKVHHGRFMKTRFAFRNGRSVGRQPFDDEIVDPERAVAEDDAQLADVHRAIEELGALLLGELRQSRSDVDGDERDDDRGDERDEDGERAQDRVLAVRLRN